MDILKEIEQQIKSIKKTDSSSYLDSIFTHIDRAELYYSKGKNDSDFFNDVIYRSNQAYEGALKESYKVLAEKNQEEVSNKSPNEIENYFETNNVFRERVLQLFKNYRREWRNKSTHDYKLFFDENEAFIALTSVTSFVHLLLKQIQEKAAYLDLQKKLEDEKVSIENVEKLLLENKNPKEKLLDIITEFSNQYGKRIFENKNTSEFEIIGLFHAYIESLKSVKATREPKFENTNARPDFLIEIDNSLMILEFKRYKASGSIIHNVENQILNYLEAANLSDGIVYFTNFKEEKPIPKIENRIIFANDDTYFITSIIT